MTGAEQAAMEPEEVAIETPDWLGEPVGDDRVEPAIIEDEEEAVPSAPRPSLAVRLLGVSLVLLALGWAGAAGWAIWQTRPALTLANAIGWIGTLSGPLILLALLWLWLGRTSRGETERFSHAVSELRAESVALESVLAIVADRLDE